MRRKYLFLSLAALVATVAFVFWPRFGPAEVATAYLHAIQAGANADAAELLAPGAMPPDIAMDTPSQGVELRFQLVSVDLHGDQATVTFLRTLNGEADIPEQLDLVRVGKKWKVAGRS